MPVKGILSGGCKPCGAKCRTKGGSPCSAPAMRGSNRCRMHFGHSRKLRTHGRLTILAQRERKQQRAFLREMRGLSKKLQLKNGQANEAD